MCRIIMVLIHHFSCSLRFISLQAPKHRSTSVIARTKLLHLRPLSSACEGSLLSPKTPTRPSPEVL